MKTSAANTEWRKQWRANSSRQQATIPTDATFAEAERAFQDEDRTAAERKAAALRGVPTPVNSDQCYPMWIPARDLTSTFSDTEIMTSLGADQKSTLWANSIVHLRDFKVIRGKGVSFTCTDREICTKLGNLQLTVCGRSFKIQPYSKYSHWYYVELQRLADDTTDSIIYDWFVAHGVPPVYITPSRTANGLQSRNRRVYFNQKDPPAVLMIGGKEPLRQIQFTASGYCVVNHRIQAYNKKTLPFLLERRRTKTSEDPPAAEASSDSPSDAGVQPTTPADTGGDSDADMGSDSDMTSLSVNPSSMWTSGEKKVTIPIPPLPDVCDAYHLIERSKKMIFPTARADQAQAFLLPPSQTTYPLVASHNVYEWITLGSEDAPISPDIDVTLHNHDRSPIRSQLTQVEGQIEVQRATIDYNVESMTVASLCKFIQAFLQKFEEEPSPEVSIVLLKTQPSHLRPLYDTSTPSNYTVMRGKFYGHALFRKISSQELLPELDTFEDKVQAVFNPQDPEDYQTMLSQCLDHNQALFWQQVWIAEFDLLLQVMAPSIYSDPFKVCAISQAPAQRLQHTLWLLWDDATLLNLLRSPSPPCLLSNVDWTLRGYSINVNGFNRVTQSTLNYFSSKFHIIALQETKFTNPANLKRADFLWRKSSSFNTAFWSHDHSDMYTGQAGVGILLTPTCPVQDIQDITETQVSDPNTLSRYLVLQGILDGSPAYIHAVYAPVNPTDRPSFFDSLPRQFEDNAIHLALGDFNAVFSTQLDQAQTNNRARREGRQELLEWMQALNLFDAWRLQNPHVREFTSPNRSARIDFVLLSSDIFNRQLKQLKHDWKHQPNKADHCGIEFTLGSELFKPRTRAPWRCPSWVIELPEAQEYLKLSLIKLAESIDPTIASTYNPGRLLDEHKRQDCIYLRQLFNDKKNKRQVEKEDLHVRINQLQHLEHLSPSEEVSATLSSLQQKLRAQIEEEDHHKSKQKFASDLYQSEKCTKYFFRPPMLLHKTTIPVQSAEDLHSMCEEFNRYWSGVYCSPSREYSHPKPKWNPLKLSRILQHTKTRLTTEDQRMLDSPFTANDFYYALKHTTANKSPGPDGLPLAYYNVDIQLWSKILEVVYSSQFQLGKMTKFQRRGQISLLYKSGDRRVPSNYRPITLLNIDAKLGPKILSKRLQSILPKLLHTDQYGFVPGRDIRNAHLRFQALQHLFQRCQEMAGALLLDFAKAFDSVVWDALEMTLRHFGFGPNFREWIRVMIRSTIVSILFNGAPLPHFALGAGVRQGDPLSPALFVLYIEPLLNYLRVQFNPHGLKLPHSDEPHTIISFADDCTGLLSDLSLAPQFLQRVQEFCSAAGMKLNTHKTVILPFREWTDEDQELQTQLQQLGVQVIDNTGEAKLLGIRYGPRLSNTDRLHHLIASIQLRCAVWKHRARTLNGRVALLQQIVLPTLWYTASVCHIPQSGFQDQIKSVIATFLSDSSTSSSRLSAILATDWWYSKIPRRSRVRECHHSLPSWVSPVVEVFQQAMTPWGRPLDILYAPVTTSPNHASTRRENRWSALNSFWHQVLFVWHTKLRPKMPVSASQFDLLSMPLLHNATLRHGSQDRTLATRPSALVQRLAQLQLYTAEDIYGLCGSTPTPAALATAIQQPGDSRAYNTRYCRNFLVDCDIALRVLRDPPHGPRPSQAFASAFHNWVIGEHPLEDLTVAKIRNVLKCPKPPALPLQRLGVSEAPGYDFWKRDLKLNKHLLPVYADFLYRLQHNALHLGYRFQHLQDAKTTCHFDCEDLDTPQHLFWLCPFASRLWDPFLQPLQRAFASDLSWGTLVYFSSLQPTPQAKEKYGYTLFVVLNFVRAIVTRCIWMHRNDIRFHGQVPNSVETQARTQALLQLHIQAYKHELHVKSQRHSALALRQLKRLIQDAGFDTSTTESNDFEEGAN
ncbi:Pollike protein, partial [Globisporangium splendens]